MSRSENREERLERIYLAMESAETLSNPNCAENLSGELMDESVERFRNWVLIGQGSTGEVYRAFDQLLQREIAIKILHSTDAGSVNQLLREARAQAKIPHENICRVYETGTFEGKPFIAMQFIDGVPLRTAMDRMRYEEKIRIMISVAEAIDAAHKTGLIHRDLKPGNIMIEESDRGSKPFVMDFGLAREQESPGVTMTGSIVGSPSYMAPEQARGEIRKLDRRTDIYGLGATLFELFTGRPPFQAENTAEVIIAILQEEPERLRKIDPGIPADLEAIVLKCLEKNPNNRYQSAKSLADDLRNYLNGEPVTARRAGLIYVILRKARKHRKATAVAAAGIAALVVLSGFWIKERVRSSEQARFAQLFGQEAERIEGFLRYAATLPLHDLNRERVEARKRIHWIEDEMKSLPSEAEAPASYALGRSFLALHETEKALQYLEDAWQNGFQTPEAAASIGRTYAALYKNALGEIGHLNSIERKQKKDEIDRNYRASALKYLQLAKSSRSESLPYVEGIVAFLDGRYPDAIQKARLANTASPWMYESTLLEGDSHLFQGIELRRIEKWQEAKREYQKAGEAYAQALQIARSDPAVYLSECERHIQSMEIRINMERTFPSEFKEAAKVCEQVLLADPANAEALDKLSRIYYRTGEYQLDHGQDHYKNFETAIAFGERASKIDPAFSGYIGIASWKNALYEIERGIDPERSLSRAVECAEKEKLYSLLAVSLHAKGEYFQQKGMDPQALYSESIRYSKLNLRLNPELYEPYNNIGCALVAQAAYSMQMEKNPLPLIEEAIENFERVIKVWPKYPAPNQFMASAYLQRTDYELMSGLNPEASIQNALSYSGQAVRLDPYFADGHDSQGSAYQKRAIYILKRGRNPSKDFAMAHSAFEQAIRYNPQYTKAWRHAARNDLLFAEFLLNKKMPAHKVLADAEVMIQEALKLNPVHFEGYLLKGWLQILRSNLPSAKEAFLKASALNPHNPEVQSWLNSESLVQPR